MKFDGPLGDVFAFQDEVTEVIVANLAVEIRVAELRRAVDSAPAKLSAYGLILRGEFLTHRYQRAANWRAKLLFERARRVDPGYGRAYAVLSRTFNLDWRYAWSKDPIACLDRALELAELAIRYDPLDARGHAELGFACLYRKQHDAALAAYERAIELNPNDADILAEMGDALTSVGQHERAATLLSVPCASTRSIRTGIFGFLEGFTSTPAIIEGRSIRWRGCETLPRPTGCWRRATRIWARWSRRGTMPRS